MQVRRAMDTERVEAGKRLLDKREAAQVSVALMAHLLDCDPKTIANYETGRTKAGGAVEFAYDNIDLLIATRLGRRPLTWDDAYGSYEPRLFDPDEPAVVTDLSERIMARVDEIEPIALLQNAS
jgi:predicted transcriptional regulator